MTNKIKDLDFLETFNRPTAQIWGGVYTKVSVSTYTSQNSARAGARAIALGNNTSTWTQTTTNVSNMPYISNSYAQASGVAWAQTGSEVSVSIGASVSASISNNYV